jgi:hypothetical protein
MNRNSLNQVSLDTDNLIIRRVFAFDSNNNPIPENHILSMSSNSEAKWVDTLRNIESYGVGYLPDVFADISGRITGLSNYFGDGLVDRASELGFLQTSTFNQFRDGVVIDISNMKSDISNNYSKMLTNINILDNKIKQSSITQSTLDTEISGVISQITSLSNAVPSLIRFTDLSSSFSAFSNTTVGTFYNLYNNTTSCNSFNILTNTVNDICNDVTSVNTYAFTTRKDVFDRLSNNEQIYSQFTSNYTIFSNDISSALNRIVSDFSSEVTLSSFNDISGKVYTNIFNLNNVTAKTIDISNSLTSNILKTFDISNSLTSNILKTFDISNSLTSNITKTFDISNSLTSNMGKTYDVSNSLTSNIGKTNDVSNSLTSNIGKTNDISNSLYNNTALKIGNIATKIGIGYGATNPQNNSIVINANNASLSADLSNAFFVKPIRQTSGTNALFYNNTSGEITFDTISTSGVSLSDFNDLSGEVYSRLDSDTIKIGTNAGLTNQNQYAIAIGSGAGSTNQKFNSIAIGRDAGNSFQSNSAIAIGNSAGNTSQYAYAIAIGYGAGSDRQFSSAISIGYDAGNMTQKGSAIAIGASAGYYGQDINSIAIGGDAAKWSQICNSIAIGVKAGYSNQNSNSIGIGYLAAYDGQSNTAIAIGKQAGYNSQRDNSIAIGTLAGYTNNGGGESIAIGKEAGYRNQSYRSIAIGSESGQSNQGEYAIAIGFQAGKVGQVSNSIIINASDLSLNATTNPGLYIAPIRDTTAATSRILLYDNIKSEVHNTASLYYYRYRLSGVNQTIYDGFFPSITTLDPSEYGWPYGTPVERLTGISGTDDSLLVSTTMSNKTADADENVILTRSCTNVFWKCPLSGIWQITVSLRTSNDGNNSMIAYGNYTKKQFFNVNQTTSTVYIEKNDYILIGGHLNDELIVYNKKANLISMMLLIPHSISIEANSSTSYTSPVIP